MVAAYDIPPPSIVSIADDHGGAVWEYVSRASQWRASGVRVRLSGACYSACTVYLSLGPQRLCVAPNAVFGFHQAYYPGRFGAPQDDVIRGATAAMYQSYPASVRGWLGPKGLTVGMRYMSGVAAVRLGAVSACK